MIVKNSLDFWEFELVPEFVALLVVESSAGFDLMLVEYLCSF